MNVLVGTLCAMLRTSTRSRIISAACDLDRYVAAIYRRYVAQAIASVLVVVVEGAGEHGCQPQVIARTEGRVPVRENGRVSAFVYMVEGGVGDPGSGGQRTR
jgi:hypothetical protein